MKESRKDNLVYIDDILGAIKKIRAYTKNVAANEFPRNDMLVDAVVRNLEIIGEASSKLAVSFRNEHNDIEWWKIIGMRNRIIHAYDMVDQEIVWDVVQYDLPQLNKKLKKLIKK
jgi:uncharacterized protein with HEPN domain